MKQNTATIAIVLLFAIRGSVGSLHFRYNSRQPSRGSRPSSW